ncbi:MAG: outer rane autotransporter [Moraxellaceae bacterium]|nr:outer rane autotransporter [Moraxellaceae bacterium]
MPARRKPALTRSLLSYSIAAVVAGMVPAVAAADGLSIIINTGTITVTPVIGGSGTATTYGIDAGDLASSSLVNSGNITAEYYGINATSITNASLGNTGHITVGAVLGRESDDAWGLSAGSLADGASISNGGAIDVAVSTGSSAAVFGIGTGNLSGGSMVTNSGTITATAHSASGSVEAYGIGTDDLSGGSMVTNSGTITATARSVSDWAEAYGIGTDDLSGGSTVANSGTIVATADSVSDSAQAYGFRTGKLTHSYIANSGTIAASVRGGDSWIGACGVCMYIVDSASTFDNGGSILASATSANASATGSAFGVYVSQLAAGAIFVNTGSIVATGSDAMDVYGIRISSGDGTVTNAGDITGDVYLGGTVSLLNTGNILLAAGQGSHVGGHYAQGAGGQLSTVVRDAQAFGRIDIVGTADFGAGGRLVVQLDPALQLATGTVLADVVTAGSLVAPAGGYDIVDSSPFWRFANVGDATSIDLVATRVDAATALAGSDAALTDSQLALVDAVVSGRQGTRYAALAGALNSAATAPAAAAIVRQLNPALTGAAGRAAQGASQRIGEVVQARQAETGAASGDDVARNGLWLKTFIGSAEQETVASIDGFEADSAGFVLGLDGSVGDDWRLGVAVASARTDADNDSSSLRIDSLQFTLYGSKALSDSTSLDIDVSHGVNGIDSTRRVGFASSIASASYDGRQSTLGVGLTRRVAMTSGLALLPSLQARYRQVHLDGYTETGAGAYDLSVQGRSDSALLGQAKLGLEVGLGGHGTLLVNAGIGYDTLDAATATATLSGNGPTFISEGATPESTVLNAGIGYRYVTAKGVEINALYEFEDRDTFTADTASLKLRMPF